MIIKYTEGHVKQIFDNNGKLLSQEFKAQNETTYMEETELGRRELDVDRPENNFYHPFNMEQPT